MCCKALPRRGETIIAGFACFARNIGDIGKIGIKNSVILICLIFRPRIYGVFPDIVEVFSRLS